ncbi:nucleotide-diphospho-sugar transferase [Teratosphaeria nubilosa]|uniref:Nucleotide-diphospho-sugar transferase n=1 Tax=Teratosphaeria nubilosa TaxID=161662 RepID=A0A6G1L9E2_9PEZI|nr:nucleotide-diphospho-sugar transferase [Teratosphaeria nubilosa]
MPFDEPANGPVDIPANQPVDQFVDAAKKTYYAGQPYPTFDSVQSTYAYATFLAGPYEPELIDDIHRDKYFIATRILAYQLLHAPETRTQNHYPFIVLVTDDVPEHKRDRLRRDGAMVWEAPALDSGWVKTEISTWQKVLSKLRLWQLTQFERIAFLDGDTVLTTPLDGIFEDRAVNERITNDNAGAISADESPMPFSYVLAGVPEMNAAHHFPPTDEQNDWPNVNYLNAGFFVLKPSLQLMQYYATLTAIPERFDPHLPEQNLLNYAHRREGNMPWVQLDTRWNMHYPTVDDLKGGVASLHEKWWDPVNKDLKPFLQSWRWRMEGYWEARDASLV